MTFTLRNARSVDSAAVRAVVQSVLREYGLQFDPDNTDADLANVQANYESRGGVFQVIESPAGVVVGCGGLFPLDATTVELRKMYLASEARGRGLGKKMLMYLLAEARRLGYKRVVLETNSVLKEAIALYRSFGFMPVVRQHLSDRCDQDWELWLTSEPHAGDMIR